MEKVQVSFAWFNSKVIIYMPHGYQIDFKNVFFFITRSVVTNLQHCRHKHYDHTNGVIIP